jgi:gluconate 2-dehydrogenase gamma chain
MNRREVLEKAALVLGYAITGPTLVGVMNGCKAAPELNYKPVFFTEDQARLIAEMAEIILPRTTTPGAKDVGVPSFIDNMLKEVYLEKEQESFIQGLIGFDEEAKKSKGDNFINLDAEEQVAFVKEQQAKALEGSAGSGSQGWWNTGGGNDRPFILKVKELTILGFFTSQAGATEVLQYNPVPGPYQGCVPLEKVGKAWAT